MALGLSCPARGHGHHRRIPLLLVLVCSLPGTGSLPGMFHTWYHTYEYPLYPRMLSPFLIFTRAETGMIFWACVVPGAATSLYQVHTGRCTIPTAYY